MRHHVRVLGRAEADLVEIAAYRVRGAPESTDRLVEGLLSAMEKLAELPRRGARARDDRLRRRGFRYLVEGHYLIFYKIAGKHVRIYRVLHGRRSYEHLL